MALSSDEVLTLLSESIVLRDPDLYLNVISRTFVYEASQSAYPDNPAFFQDWTFNREDNFIRTLMTPTVLPPESLSVLTLEPVSEPEIGADSVFFRESYRLDIHTTRTDLPSEFEGLMEVTVFREQGGEWRIGRWRDEAQEGAFSMSQLRAAFAGL